MALSLTDLALLTMAKYPDDRSFVTVLPRQRWLFCDHLMNESTMMMANGTAYTWPMAYRVGTAINWRKSYAVRNPQITNYFTTASVTIAQSDYDVVITDEELLTNANVANARDTVTAIVDVVKARRQLRKLAYLNDLETAAFALPVLTGDNQTTLSLPYHFPPVTAGQVAGGTGAGAFQGQFASGFTTWQGIDVSLSKFAALRSWNANWKGGSADTVEFDAENSYRLAKAMLNINYRAPRDSADLKLPAFNRMRLATDQYMLFKMGAAARQQNDTLGSDALKYMGVDLAKRDGTVLANGFPIDWATQLDTADTTNRGAHPLYLYNLDRLKVLRRRGWWMKRREAARDGVHQPGVAVEHVENHFTLPLMNRQDGGALLSWVAAE